MCWNGVLGRVGSVAVALGGKACVVPGWGAEGIWRWWCAVVALVGGGVEKGVGRRSRAQVGGRARPVVCLQWPQRRSSCTAPSLPGRLEEKGEEFPPGTPLVANAKGQEKAGF